MKKRFAVEVKEILKEVLFTVFTLLKIIIPISIIVKILKEFGVIDIIGRGLSPLMKVVGLPGESGLVWATAMVTNIYGGLVVFFSMAMNTPFSVAQVTILSSMILIAHSLPVELRIGQQAGVKLWFLLLLRICGAFILGCVLYRVYSAFHFLERSAVILWRPGVEDPSILGWILAQLRNYGFIFLIIFILISLIRILKYLGIIDKLNRLLHPLLRVLGMSKEAAPLAIIGLTLGISYGGGLIINEARSGKLSKRDIFLSLSLMSMSHSLIEDTLLMVAMGASLTGILLGRIIFTFLAMLLLIRIVRRITDHSFKRYLIRRDVRKETVKREKRNGEQFPSAHTIDDV
jgi:hypothetical protein